MTDRPPLGEIKVDDELIVLAASYGRGARKVVPVRVDKAARVWLDLVEIDNASSLRRTWRMRRDTQNEGGQYSTQARFLTPEQHTWETARDIAFQFLRSQGISMAADSPWRNHEVELAALIKAGVDD